MKSIPFEERLFRLKETAEILAVHPKMIRTHIASGALQAIRTGESKGYRVSGASIRAFIKDNMV